ncbi:unnamed protein product [Caenorhabditis brenneri]
MVAIPTFPLLGLPDDEVLRTLRVMDLEQILNFSLISKRCKELVTSIKIKVTSINIIIVDEIDILIETVSSQLRLSYYTEQDMYWGMGAYGWKKKLLTPRNVEVNVFDNGLPSTLGFTLTNSELALTDWLKHLLDIFNYNGIDSMRFFEGSSNFDIDDIREVFGNKSKFYMQFLPSDAYKQLILEKFFPIEKLSIMMSNFEDSNIPPSFLIQNFEYLCIEDLFHEEVITLDELLMTNSKGIGIDGMSPKDFNKFIKLWQQGSNPNMECLSISYRNDRGDEFGRVVIYDEYNVPNTIMKGIKHDVVPANRIRKFKSVESKNPRLVHGGMDIHRKDGVKATIQTERMQFSTVWHMYVWFNHCVVES